MHYKRPRMLISQRLGVKNDSSRYKLGARELNSEGNWNAKIIESKQITCGKNNKTIS